MISTIVDQFFLKIDQRLIELYQKALQTKYQTYLLYLNIQQFFSIFQILKPGREILLIAKYQQRVLLYLLFPTLVLIQHIIFKPSPYINKKTQICYYTDEESLKVG